MAREIRRLTATIAAGTTKANPAKIDLSFPARVVREVEVVVPPGPRGEVGFAIGAAGVPVIPMEAGAFIVTNDEVIRWPLEGYWDSGSWTLFAYNTGRYPHTLEVRFLVDLVGATAALSQPLDPAGLATVVGASAGGAWSARPPAVVDLAPAPVALAPLPPPPAAPVATATNGGTVAPPPPPSSGPISSVASWYQELLGRGADPGGDAYWLALSRDHGGPLTFPQLVVRFCGTGEALAAAAAAPAAFVAGLYHVLLGRDGDPGGIGYWAGRIHSQSHPSGDLNGAQVAAAIAAGPEETADQAGAGTAVTA
ncbi:MAG TPA: hypothetical protein VHQ90_00095 [Thermoanaerobaculia bacterium]|nr:hypothetical protein [Thermoanaerobaculia bacterium]